MKTEARKRYEQEWRDRNRERVRVSQRASNKRYREAHPERARLFHVVRKFGVSMKEAQHLEAIKRCQICGKPSSLLVGKVRRYSLDVDHNHRTMKVRGKLCRQCNRGLGHFKDSPKLLRKAAGYLEKRDA